MHKAGNLKERYHLGYLRVHGRIILKFVLKKDMRVWTGLIWLRTGTSGEIF
jgi:hypothetical protein